MLHESANTTDDLGTVMNITSFRKESSESGFTLIEILVVILIIGILSAIAIPVFLNQRKAANESAIRSDLRNLAIAVEDHFKDNPNDITVEFSDIPDYRPSKAVVIALRGNANTWCAVATHPNSNYNTTGDVTKALTYDNANGGLMPHGWNWHTQSKCDDVPGSFYSWKTGT